MLVELNVNNITDIKESSIIYFDFKSKKFVPISLRLLMQDCENRTRNMELKLEMYQQSLELLLNQNLNDNIGLNAKAIERLQLLQAYQLLLNDVNNGEIDEPENLEELKAFVLKPSEEVPELLQVYLKVVRGE